RDIPSFPTRRSSDLPDGMVVEAETGKSILEVAHDNHIEIESACGGVCACTTCHCVIREGFNSLNEADELEEDYLDRAWGLEPTSDRKSTRLNSSHVK